MTNGAPDVTLVVEIAETAAKQMTEHATAGLTLSTDALRGGTALIPAGTSRVWDEYGSLRVRPVRVGEVADGGTTFAVPGGRVAVREGVEYVSARWFGAVGDGVADDAPALRRALYAARTMKRALYIPAGTYLLDDLLPTGQVIGGQYALYHVFLPLFGGETIYGDGDATILRVADGTSGPGINYHVIGTPGENLMIYDVDISDLRLDLNGQNNRAPAPNTKHAAVFTAAAARVRYNRITVENAGGIWCISTGKDTKPQSCRDFSVTNCRFLTVGTAVPGNSLLIDHSAVYLQVDGLTFDNNTALNSTFAPEATAFEIHASNATVTNNRAVNFNVLFNVTAQVTDAINVVYRDNLGDAVNCGYLIWTRAGMLMDGVQITGGVIRQRAGADRAIIDAHSEVQVPIQSLTVSGVELHGPAQEGTTRNNAGISLGKFANFTIRGCAIRATYGRGISLDTPSGVGNLTVENTAISDTGYGHPDHRAGIALNSTNALASARLRGNTFRGPRMTRSIEGNAPAALLEEVGNTVQDTLPPLLTGDSVRTANSGTAVIPEGQTSATVFHALAGIPRQAQVTPHTPVVVAVEKLPTQLKFVLAAPAPASGVTVDWAVSS